MKKAAIIIPVYRKKLTHSEKKSVKHLNVYLKDFDKFLIAPDSINKSPFISNKLKIVHFPKNNFKSVKTYSELLLTESFYQKFSEYKYILIYQLDALVLSNQLDEWCKQDYDYIGAPLFNSFIGKSTAKKGESIYGGNGGFSLRKVSSFIETIKLAKKTETRKSDKSSVRKLWFIKALFKKRTHNIWLDADPQDYPFNEDGFWSFEASKYNSNFKVAPLNVALKFAFERFPKKCFKMNGEKLPFGCHAWEKYGSRFWQSHL